MEFIRSRSERVQQIIQGTFEADFTKYTQRVTEMAQHKNIRLNITTEFGKEIIVTMLPGVVTAKRKFTTLRHIFPNTDILKQFLNISGSEVIRKKTATRQYSSFLMNYKSKTNYYFVAAMTI